MGVISKAPAALCQPCISKVLCRVSSFILRRKKRNLATFFSLFLGCSLEANTLVCTQSLYSPSDCIRLVSLDLVLSEPSKWRHREDWRAGKGQRGATAYIHTNTIVLLHKGLITSCISQPVTSPGGGKKCGRCREKSSQHIICLAKRMCFTLDVDSVTLCFYGF